MTAMTLPTAESTAFVDLKSDGILKFPATGTNAVPADRANVIDRIGYKILSARLLFIKESLINSAWALGASALLVIASIALKTLTAYWVIPFLLTLAYCLGILSHFLTVLFDYFYARRSDVKRWQQGS